MTDVLSFPGLGLEFTINRVAFTIGGFAVYWYAILISLGFALAMVFAFCHFKEFGLDGDRALDVILISTFAAIIGARIYYVAMEWDQYKGDIGKILDFRSGGIAIYGALIAAVACAFFVAKWRKVKFLPLLDLAVGGFFIGQAIGRWGNFVNMEAFGRNTTLPWGMTSATIQRYINTHDVTQMGAVMDPSLPVHPTFLYESLWCAAGFVLYYLYMKKRRFDGELALFYTAWYGFGRMFIEGLRTDSLFLGTMRVSQVLAGVLFVSATVAWLMVRSKIKRNNDPEYLKLYRDTEESKLIVAGEWDYKHNMSKADAEAWLDEEVEVEVSKKDADAAEPAEPEEPAETEKPEEEPAEPEETPAEQAEETAEKEAEN